MALGRAEKTLKQYRLLLKYFRQFLLEKHVRDARAVTVKLVRQYHDSLIERGLKTTSRIAYIVAVKEFLRWMFERGRILSDVSQQIEMPVLEKTLPPIPLSQEEAIDFLELVQPLTFASKRDRAMLELMYATGARVQEILSVKIGDVDGSAGTLLIRKGKGGKGRVIPIHDAALKSVAVYLESRSDNPKKTSPLWIVRHVDGTVKRLGRENLDALFRRLNRKFSRHVHPHLLRHTFAVHLLQNGCPLPVLQTYLGHERTDTTALYLNLVKTDLKKAFTSGMERILEQ